MLSFSFSFPLSQKFDLYRLDKGPAEKSTLTKEEATYALETMHYIRRMETRAADLYRLRLINGFLHLYAGQVCRCNRESKESRNNARHRQNMQLRRSEIRVCTNNVSRCIRRENGSFEFIIPLCLIWIFLSQIVQFYIKYFIMYSFICFMEITLLFKANEFWFSTK